MADPSDYWFMAAAALFIIFDDVRIASDSALGKVLCWTGERSYSIYLLQATVIGVIGSAFYTDAVFGDISGMVCMCASSRGHRSLSFRMGCHFCLRLSLMWLRLSRCRRGSSLL